MRVKFADIAVRAVARQPAEHHDRRRELHRRGQLRPGARSSRRSAASIDLDHTKDYYYHPDRNLLIELTEEVVAKLVAAEPNCSTTDRDG